jgi:predicted PurR-regulated permease PerM
LTFWPWTLKFETYFCAMIHQIHPNKIRQLLFISVLILLAFLIGKEMYFLLTSFLGAVTLYVLMRNLMFKLTFNYKWKKWMAALFLILLTVIIIVLPTIWLVSIAVQKLTPIINNPSMINSSFQTIHDYLQAEYKIDILNANNIAKMNAQVLPIVQKTIGGTLSGLGSLLVMYLILYFLLTGAADAELWVRQNIPFKNSNVVKVIGEFRNMVFSNAIGIPIVALLQGLVGLIGYWIFGTKEFILMGILTAICSVIPVVGSMLIYIPLAVYQLAIGNTWQGIGILLWGFILIGSVDNVARFMIQKKIANVHPLITIFGVLIGINIFGFLGIIFGPLLLSIFVILVKIYIDEFGIIDADEIAAN